MLTGGILFATGTINYNLFWKDGSGSVCLSVAIYRILYWYDKTNLVNKIFAWVIDWTDFLVREFYRGIWRELL